MRIGIFGGAFDPIHAGHLLLARSVYDHFNLDRFIFVPSFISPLAHGEKQFTPAAHRLEMVQAAIQNEKRSFEVSDVEIERKGVSYTVDTLRHFRKEYPAPHELFFFVGADWAKSISLWKEIDTIFSICRFVIAERPGFDESALPPSVEIFRFNAIHISSSEIRNIVKQGKPAEAWISPAVLDIIQRNHLYQ